MRERNKNESKRVGENGFRESKLKKVIMRKKDRDKVTVLLLIR